MIHKITDIPQQPQLPPHTHKGEYGKMLVIGGSSDYYGAPILTALGAECAGADLITLYLPKAHAITAKNYSLNFFVKTFQGTSLTAKDIPAMIQSSQNAHIAILGNGIGKKNTTRHAVVKFLHQVSIPTVIDADALFPEILDIPTKFKQDWIVTPHQTEFERLFQCPFSTENLIEQSHKHNFTIVVKGSTDYIVKKDLFYENHTGCVQMRVGGTGDVLAGIIGSYYAQGLDSFSASCVATHYYGLAGQHLAAKQHCFSALELSKFYQKKF